MFNVDKLLERMVALQNPSVVGLDPTPALVPPHLLEQTEGQPFARMAQAVLAFNRALIDALHDVVPAVKPQLACYEMLRHEGMQAYYETVRYAQSKGMFVIADAKRSDIGSTCDCYAAAHLGCIELFGEQLPVFDADAVTINPYLGEDGILPFLSTGKLVFILVKTSNRSSERFQDRDMEGVPLYEEVGREVHRLGQSRMGRYGYSTAGAVVGATFPAQLERLRGQLPSTLFLVPGYGAQGGGAAEAALAFDRRGLGAIVNSSRGIIGAWKKSGAEVDFARTAREAALAMREDLLKAIGHPLTLEEHP